MVRIQSQIVKVSYLKGKRLYHYKRQSLCIVKRFHSISAPFLQQDIEEDVTVQNGSLIITLTPKNRPAERIKAQAS